MIYSFGLFLLDTANYELRRGQEEITVQPRVFDLIAYLVTNHARVVTKDELLKNVWGGVAVSEASLTQAVMLARRALDGETDYIQTARGRGYRFLGNPKAGAAMPEIAPPSSRNSPSSPGQGALFGRESERKILEQARRELADGKGGTLLFAGEPGSGKTRLLEELETLGAGVRVLWGRCLPAGEGAPALWPWIQVLRGLARDGAQTPVSGALRALVPELGGGTPGAPPQASSFLLLDEMARLVSAGPAPLVLLLDDLQWADELSLGLLRRVSAAALGARLLVAGAYRRDAEARGPLAPTIDSLIREGKARLRELRGLDGQAVRGWLERALRRPVADEELAMLLAQTNGNPLFLALLLGDLRGSKTPVGPSEVLEIAKNTGISASIHRHLDVLPEEGRGLLAVASIFGQEFSLSPLCNAARIEPAAALRLLDDALRLEILREVSGKAGRYRFMHELLCVVLYERLGLAARVELHLRAAEALIAQRERGGGASLAEISHHFYLAAPACETAEAVGYTLRAAEEASEARLYREAVRFYERALGILEVGQSEPGRRVDVLLALGLAAFRAGNAEQAREVFERTGALAREMGAGEKLAQAALGYALDDDLSAIDHRRVALLQEGLAAVAGSEGGPRALLTGRLALAQRGTDETVRRGLAHQAVSMARAAGDPVALAYTLRCLHDVLLSPEFLDERSAIAQEQITIARQAGNLDAEIRGLVSHIHDRLELGDLPGAHRLIERHEAIAGVLRQPAYTWQAQRYRVLDALRTGDLDGAEAILGELGGSSGHHIHQLWALRRAQGRLPELLPLLAEELARSPRRALRRATFAQALLASGDADRASRELTLALDAMFQQGRDRDWLPSATACAELALQLEQTAPLPALLESLRPYRQRFVVYGLGAVLGPGVASTIGRLAARLGRVDEAREALSLASEQHRATGASLHGAGPLQKAK